MSSALQEFTSGELVKMVTEGWVPKVIIGFEDAIRYSFNTDGLIVPIKTRNEIERRFKILIKWFIILRRDLHWSVPRIIDECPRILRTELDGGTYEPDEYRDAWQGRGEAPEELEPDGDDMAGDVPDVPDAIEVEGI